MRAATARDRRDAILLGSAKSVHVVEDSHARIFQKTWGKRVRIRSVVQAVQSRLRDIRLETCQVVPRGLVLPSDCRARNHPKRVIHQLSTVEVRVCDQPWL